MTNSHERLLFAVAIAFGVGILVPAYAQRSAVGGRSAPNAANPKPDLNGIWQVLNSAAWDLEDHGARADAPAGQSVVEGGVIPYQDWAEAQRNTNREKAVDADPLSQCFLPGVPRVTYLPFPFQIAQTPNVVAILYEWSRTPRLIYTDGSRHPEGLEFWMGDSRGHWEGGTLVVDVDNFNDKTWLDKAGNFHSSELHVVERYTRISPDVLSYEATIEDPKVFTRPWRIQMALHRRSENNAKILEYECLEFLEQRRYKPSK